MSSIDKTVEAVDRFQQRKPWLAFPVAVWKKFNDDQAGHLAALITYYAVAAIFPLLLILGTVLNITLGNHPELRAKLLNSALSQYPVVGPEIQDNLGQINGTGLALVFGFVILVYGSRGAAAAMQRSMCDIWDVPREERPGFPVSLGYNALLTITVGSGFMLTTFISGLAGGAGHLLTGIGAHAGAIIVSFVLNVGMFWLSFRLASVRKIPYRELRGGAIAAAVVWQVLQLAGGYVVAHQLHRASALYGTFGVVIGLMAWVYLQAEVTLYAAEIDVVLVRKLWPRSLKSDDGDQPRVPGQRSNPDRVGTADGSDSSGTKVA
jgi:YihY family inner membrane protein